MKDINSRKEICTFFEKKLSLFKKYLSITKRMEKALKDKETAYLGSLVSERQDLINKIERINFSIEKIIKVSSGKFRDFIENYSKSIANIMETIVPMDRELMAIVTEESEGIKTELLNMRDVRQAAHGYKNEGRHSPRFLDMKR